MDARDLILSDAIEQCIESERKIIKLKRVIAIMSIIILALALGYLV